MTMLGPRIVIAAPRSGAGKTTVATGLLAAFRHRGLRVRSAKVGPDFIDPGYHSLATGHPSRNLDPWISGLDSIGALAGRASTGGELLIVEGVMGLFDGAADGTPASTAEVAVALDAPVVLVVDCSAMSGSVAALVHGFCTFDSRVRIGGVILNQVGSPTHRDMLTTALTPLGVPVLGALPRSDTFHWRDRHLGLVPVVENRTEIAAALDRVAAAIEEHCDLEAIATLARAAPPKLVDDPKHARLVGSVRIALATGPAFSFTYPDNVEALEAAGATIVPFDPCVDRCLPDRCEGMVIGGGFPEVYAERLAANRPLIDDVRRAARDGLVIWADCGGLLWLSERLDNHAMVGLLPATAQMTSRLTLGYRRAVTTRVSPLGPAGRALRGHEFHYSTTAPQGDALDVVGASGTDRSGFATAQVFASYLHTPLGVSPALAEQFITSVLA